MALSRTGFSGRGPGARSSNIDVSSSEMPLNVSSGGSRTTKDEAGRTSGAQGRNRTTDTAIFSRMLYQLSYLGRHLGTHCERQSGRWSERL